MRLQGFTLVELLTTLAIIGLMATAALPALRGLQARQSLLGARQSVEAALSSIAHRSLAPPQEVTGPSEGKSTPYDTVGYGLYFFHRLSAAPAIALKDGQCLVQTDRDFVVLFRIIRFDDPGGGLEAFPAFAQPTAPGQTGCSGTVDPTSYPNYFSLLPLNVRFSPGRSAPPVAFPWFFALPLSTVGQGLGILPGPRGTNNPLARDEEVRLVIEHTNLKDNGHPPQPLSQIVRFAGTGHSLRIEEGK